MWFSDHSYQKCVDMHTQHHLKISSAFISGVLYAESRYVEGVGSETGCQCEGVSLCVPEV